MHDSWLQRYPRAAAMLQGEDEVLAYDATESEASPLVALAAALLAFLDDDDEEEGAA